MNEQSSTYPPVAVALAQLPGDPSCRSTLAWDADDRHIAKAFKENPTSRWVITPTRVVERVAFFQPKPQPPAEPLAESNAS